MVKPIYLFLATGFQETEAIAPVTVCRKAGLLIKTVSITGQLWVESAMGVTVKADMLFEEADFSDAAMLVMPGGMPGSTNLSDYAPLQEVIMQHYKAGTPLAAICAAPSILGHKGLLQGRKAIAYPGFETQLAGAEISEHSVEQSDFIITAQGAGAALPFGLKLTEVLTSSENAKKLADAVCYPEH